MRRWAWLILALAATSASARLTTFGWDNNLSWPAGTTVELCSNGICADGLTGTQHTLDVPIQPGERFDARARAMTTDGQVSPWATLAQTWPAAPVGFWARSNQKQMTIAVTHLDGGATATTNPVSTASIAPTANAQVLVAVGIGADSVFGSTDFGSLSISGCNLSWSEVAHHSNSTSRRVIFVWRGVGASPTTGNLSITYTPPAGRTFQSMKWSVDEFTGVDSTTPLGTPVGNIAYSATASTTLSAPSTGDWVYAAVALATNQDTTINSELDTDLYEIGDTASIARLHVAVDTAPDSNPVPGFSLASSSAWFQIGVTIKAAAASAASSLVPPIYTTKFAHLLVR